MPARRIENTLRVALVAFLAFGLPCVAHAEAESVHIDYAAPAGCPDGAAFLGALRMRTTRFRPSSDEQARRFRVRVSAGERAFSGALEIRGTDGSTAVRRVDAAVCAEVTDALALMTALAIDPDALLNPPAPQPEGRPAAPDVEPAEPDPVRVARIMPPPPPAQPPQIRTPSPPWRWSAGLHGHSTFLLAPGLGYGGELFVDAEAPPSSRLGPAVRMGVFLQQSDVDLPSGAGARFRWAAAALDGCPVRLAMLHGRLALHPCLAFHLGGLHGAGRDMAEPRRAWSLWADAGLVLRLRIAATEHLLLEAQGQVVLPLYRPKFEITDNFTPWQAYAVPRLGVTTGIGAAYRFE
jgi:hypothetical protein